MPDQASRVAVGFIFSRLALENKLVRPVNGHLGVRLLSASLR